ncbi:semaphorin-6A-like [Paroedura picta]|uniref:semaphorin-6A-like n=1 Tax=Paroedura picta TaxID=143630 RepID=UPI004057BAD0
MITMPGILLLCFTLWNLAGAYIPEDLNPFRINFYRKHYLAFDGYIKNFDSERIKLDIQQLLIVHRRLYVTARNSIYVINLDKTHQGAIYYNNRLIWNADPDQKEKCQSFGKTEEECQNYFKVLVQTSDTVILICGTNAFDPVCAYHKVETFTNVGSDFGGRGMSPFDGKDHNIALFADGSLYTGTVNNFLSTDPVFQRMLGDLPNLRTASQNLDWLYDPHFIHALEYGNYVYFFFHEVSLELKNYGKVILPRVARVCKNDRGGRKVLQKQWTSFLKARMICSVDGDIPFYFNTLRSVTDVIRINGREIVVGVFTTPKNSIPGSAVCAFDMEDIKNVFKGSFKKQMDYNTIWTSVHEDDVPSPRPGTCAGSEPFEDYTSSTEFPDAVLIFMKRHHLMHEAVSSTFTRPWFLMTTARYQLTYIVIDTAAGPNEDQIVAFLGTEQGRVLKVWDTSGNGPILSDSLLVEEMNVYKREKCDYNNEELPTIVSMKLDKPTRALYVAFPSCIIRVPLGSCVLYGQCKKACIASRDPYCVWMTETGECKHFVPGDSGEYEQDLEEGNVSGMDDC